MKALFKKLNDKIVSHILSGNFTVENHCVTYQLLIEGYTFEFHIVAGKASSSYLRSKMMIDFTNEEAIEAGKIIKQKFEDIFN